MTDRDLPSGWRIWHDRPDDIFVLTYRPDVFDSDAFPASCLPTVTVKPARARGRSGRPRDPESTGPWVAELLLEPDAPLDRRRAADRSAAIEAGLELAGAFVEGTYDLGSPYADPPSAYLERLESLLTGGP